MPHTVCIVESRGIANRSCISVRRVDADTQSKTGTIISSAAVISATAAVIGIPAMEVSPGGRREGVSSAKPAGVSATTTGCECRYRTYPHRNDESGRREYLSNQLH